MTPGRGGGGGGGRTAGSGPVIRSGLARERGKSHLTSCDHDHRRRAHSSDKNWPAKTMGEMSLDDHDVYPGASSYFAITILLLTKHRSHRHSPLICRPKQPHPPDFVYAHDLCNPYTRKMSYDRRRARSQAVSPPPFPLRSPSPYFPLGRSSFRHRRSVARCRGNIIPCV